LIANFRKGGKMLKLATPYVLIAVEFDIFAYVIENLKTLIGHVSTMAQYISWKKFGGLKSHDYHVLMQQILSFIFRCLLAPRPQMAIMKILKSV
jgi:hypothetical protein